MKIRELFEDVDTDVQFSQYGEWVRLAIIRDLETRLSKGDPRSPMVKGIKTGHSVLDAMVQHLMVTFGPDHGGSYGKTEYGVPVIVLGIGTKPTYEAALKFIKGPGASTFRHEFQHYLEKEWVHDKHIPTEYDAEKVVGSSRDRRAEASRYYNDPQEQNSYFHELAEPMLKILRAAAENDFEAVKAAGTVEGNFDKYLKEQFYWQADTQAWDFYQHLTPENRQTFKARLLALHTAATALQGVSSPYQLTGKQHVLSWLQKALRGLGVSGALKKVDAHLTRQAMK